MGFEIKKYYDEFVKSFVKIKNTQILGVHKQYLKIKEKFKDVLPIEEQEDFDNDYAFIQGAFNEMLTSQPYIVAVSAYQGEQFEQQAKKFKIDETMGKPAEINQLKKLISEKIQ